MLFRCTRTCKGDKPQNVPILVCLCWFFSSFLHQFRHTFFFNLFKNFLMTPDKILFYSFYQSETVKRKQLKQKLKNIARQKKKKNPNIRILFRPNGFRALWTSFPSESKCRNNDSALQIPRHCSFVEIKTCVLCEVRLAIHSFSHSLARTVRLFLIAHVLAREMVEVR